MNDFKYIKPSGAIKLPDNSNIEVKDGKVKVKDIPIPDKSYLDIKKPEIELNPETKLKMVKDWYQGIILSGDIPKTPTGLLILLALGFVIYWLMS